jgi:hypothetical protein
MDRCKQKNTIPYVCKVFIVDKSFRKNTEEKKLILISKMFMKIN